MNSVSRLLLPLTSLSGVGVVIHKYLLNLVGRNKIFALLLHKPIAVEKIIFCPRLFEVKNNELIIIKAKIEAHIPPAKARQPFKIICYTPTGYLNLVFFKIFPSQLAKMKIGNEVAILGYFDNSSGENQIVHPQEICDAKLIDRLPKNNVIYPLSTSISQKFLLTKIKEVLQKIDEKNDEWIDQILLKQQSWPNFIIALKNLHNPNSASDLLPQNSARQRLAYDELLAWQIAVLLAKRNSQRVKNFIKAEKKLGEEFLVNLPFLPTKSQLAAMKEIETDIYSNKKMLRLLQGDVGSGKTMVAIFACLLTISQSKQSCVIVPTTTLAKQHFSYFCNFLQNFNLRILLLTSAVTKKQKAKIVEDLMAGKIDILIGTHALLEEEIKFKNLGLAVIDEQHRFGVIQRLKLVEKGDDVDVLLMSATPIPRSLMMGLYGDMDISTLREKPKNRQKIITSIMSERKSDELHQAIKRAISCGEKVYWICPAIEESCEIENLEVNFTANENRQMKNDLVSVRKKYDELTKIFGEKTVSLLHGKMKEDEKEKVMADFSKSGGETKLLVATTVIEVGIDVSDATIIVIENAEHFGLAQLHQLRGRVGRSEKKSFCILLYGKKFGSNARQRLNILRQVDDGFFIAEEDLKIRGSGELLGTKQSGFPEFKIADLNFDAHLLKIAHKQAKIILNSDPKLEQLQSLKFRNLLQLFSYDECLKMIVSG